MQAKIRQKEYQDKEKEIQNIEIERGSKEKETQPKQKETQSEHKETKSKRQEIIDGLKAAVPIIFGYFPIGMAFGVLAAQEGLTRWEVFFMSLLVFAGSAQFIAVGMLAAGVSVAAIVFTTFLVNARHILMSAALSPYFKGFSPKTLFLLGIGVTDEAFAVDMAEVKNRPRSADFFLALHFTAQFFWVFSTVIGAVVGNLVPDPQSFGLHFALPAMFIGLLLMQIKAQREVVLALLTGALSIGLVYLLPGKWNIILAAVLTATIGVILEKWKVKSSSSL